MKNIFRNIIIGLGATLTIGIGTALAIDDGGPIDKAISAKLIGEQYDGYLGFTPLQSQPSIELQRAINVVNAKRKAIYTGVASDNAQTVDKAARLQAMRQIQKAPIGSYFLDTSSNWCEKTAKSKSYQATDGSIIISCN